MGFSSALGSKFKPVFQTFLNLLEIFIVSKFEFEITYIKVKMVMRVNNPYLKNLELDPVPLGLAFSSNVLSMRSSGNFEVFWAFSCLLLFVINRSPSLD